MEYAINALCECGGAENRLFNLRVCWLGVSAHALWTQEAAAHVAVCAGENLSA